MRTRPLVPLAANDVHVRYCLTTSLDERALAAAAAVLSSEERSRRDAFHFDRDRREYTAAHALLRITLSEFGERSPEAWQFEPGSHGKPALAPDQSAARLSFNLAHTLGLVACVVAAGPEVGIDVERVTRLTDWRGIATRYFAPGEVDHIERAADGDQAARFFELWTLKEAFAKALGMGLSQPLRSTTFQVEADGAVGFVPPTGIQPSAWQFALYAPTSDHRMAVAVGDSSSQPWHLCLRRCERFDELPAA